MDMKQDLFTYRHPGSIQAFGLNTDTLLVATSSILVEWDRVRRRIVKEIRMDEEIVDIKCFSGYWVLITKSDIGFLDGNKTKRIGSKGSLDVSIVYKDWLLTVGNEKLVIISIRKGNAEIRKVRLISTNGMCTCGVAATDGLFLSFENGKVFSIKESEVMNIVLGKINEVVMDKFSCLIFLKEAIVSISTLGKELVISLFNKKVLVLDLDTKDVSYTELPHNIRGSTVWNDLIVVSDCKNNILFLDRRLRITYSNCLKEEICGVLADRRGLAIGFRVGVVKEYVGESRTRPGVIRGMVE
ncbi:hypothetical protein EROM_060920 [Encephalitozoon romaleae SJ-2008]|uniref:Uncharacterized protein n=1 Tax=Encephalitozoon romaleae (strain SJ-2008) TaxID=1178016 RepID=I7AN75_ENCRO|nr:hypothetical protein EROM_060920 [Encephalitozoon romaleae SJ-2008]AFN83184.1 hypothetical protein EROM_060920 [Encephalitozoon romaleae SJ-2008]